MTIPELTERLYQKYGSYAKAARAVDMSETAVHAWRDNRTIPGFQLKAKLAEALGMPEEEIRQTLLQAHEARAQRRAVTVRRGAMGFNQRQSRPPRMPAAKVTLGRLAHAAAR